MLMYVLVWKRGQVHTACAGSADACVGEHFSVSNPPH